MHRYSAYDTSPRYVGEDARHARQDSVEDDTSAMLIPSTPSPRYEAYRSPHSGPRREPSEKVYRSASQLYDPPNQSHNFHAELESYQEYPPLRHPPTGDTPECGPQTHLRNSIASSVTRSSKQYHRNARHLREPWTPGVWHNLPWRGLGALFLLLPLTAMSATLVFLSNGRTPLQFHVGRDTVSPAVYLSIIELLSILLTFYALAQGLTISFWVNLILGTTIADIHDSHTTTQLLPTLRYLIRGHVNKTALSTLLTTITLARGPIFQRAITLHISPDSTATYHSSLPFATIGIFLSLLGFFAILPLYHGFWDLGRPVSMNPLEIARAFGAPMFDGIDGNATAGDVEMQKGGVKVRYGAVVSESLGGEKVLRVCEMGRTSVRMPGEGEIFG